MQTGPFLDVIRQFDPVNRLLLAESGRSPEMS